MTETAYNCEVKRIEELTVETEDGEITKHKMVAVSDDGTKISVTQEDGFSGLGIGSEISIKLFNPQKTLE